MSGVPDDVRALAEEPAIRIVEIAAKAPFSGERKWAKPIMLKAAEWIAEAILADLLSRPSVQPLPSGADKMAPGCCSASSPCAHQKRNPATICDVCAKADKIAEAGVEPAGLREALVRARGYVEIALADAESEAEDYVLARRRIAPAEATLALIDAALSASGSDRRTEVEKLETALADAREVLLKITQANEWWDGDIAACRADKTKKLARAYFAAPDSVVWPAGCIKRSSCARHHQCVYGTFGGCQHAGRDIRAEVDRAALSASEGDEPPAAPSPEGKDRG